MSDYVKRAKQAGLTWEEAQGLSDAEVGSEAVSAAGAKRAVGACAGRLRLGAQRAAAASRRDAAAIVERVPGGGIRGPIGSKAVPVQPVLRAVPGVSGEACAVDAPGASRRREGVHRLLGQEAAHRRSEDWRGDGGRALRDGARGEQLHVRGGDAHPERSRTSSARRCAGSSTSAGCRRCWCRISSGAR